MALNPNLLIFVEGANYASWLGADYRPLHLATPNRLVHSVHNYAMSQSFTDCPTLRLASATMSSAHVGTSALLPKSVVRKPSPVVGPDVSLR